MNYFDGEWRPVTDHSHKALERLRTRGFELGNDRYGKLMARWPIGPALTFSNVFVIAYWQDEILRDCAISLARLRRIVSERGCGYDKTLEGLR